MPAWARAPGRQVLVANGDGVIVAGIRHELIANGDGTISTIVPIELGILGRRLIDVLGPTQPLTTFGAAAGVLEIPLADGSLAFATVRSLPAIARRDRDPAQPRRRARGLASDTALTVTLSATTGFVVLILGFAFHWQATRAREADVIYETVRSRIDTALNRGRCGLWDWDLARGRIFWSHSMFAILGLEPRDDAADLRRGQRPRASRRHPALRARRPARRCDHDVDRPRLPHAPRQRQLGVAARPLRAGPAGRRRRTASDRDRGRHHRAEDIGRAHGRGGLAPARRHRDHPRSLRGVGRAEPTGTVQLEFPGAAQPAR